LTGGRKSRPVAIVSMSSTVEIKSVLEAVSIPTS
jgi:hypothetical protein